MIYTYIGKFYKSSIHQNSWLAYINNIQYITYMQNIIFIDINGIITPFFISYYKQIHKNKFLFQFDDSINSENFIGKYLYLNIPNLNSYTHPYNYLINYQAIDIHQGNIGIINKINDQFPQNLFEIINNNHKRIILIPIVNDLIHNINNIKKIIIFDLPEGLINIF